jgi:hypothetical protein
MVREPLRRRVVVAAKAAVLGVLEELLAPVSGSSGVSKAGHGWFDSNAPDER